MADYKQMYLKLFNEVTEVVENLKNIQQQCEEIFIQTDTEQRPDDKTE